MASKSDFPDFAPLLQSEVGITPGEERATGVASGIPGGITRTDDRKVVHISRKYFPYLVAEYGLENFHGGEVPDPTAFGAVSYPFYTVAQLTANTNDWNIPLQSFSSFRIDANGAVNVTGIVASSNGRDVEIVNHGANVITFTNQDVLSAAANRIITGTGAAIALAQDQWIMLKYDPVTVRWRVK